MTNLDRLAAILGSRGAVARAAGVDPSLVTRWAKPDTWKSGRNRGNNGRIPAQHNRAIMISVAKMMRSMPLDAAIAFQASVLECLDPAVCPTCGQPIDDGRVL